MASLAIESSTATSLFSWNKQSRRFCNVHMRIYSHSLQLDCVEWCSVVQDGVVLFISAGTGINVASGQDFCISCRIPLSVATIYWIWDASLLAIGDGRLAMGDGLLDIGDGRWAMGDGLLDIGDGLLAIA